MSYRHLPLAQLLVNPSNDRHGELENETAAIVQLFAAHEQHMRSLAKDLVDTGEVFEPPLVFPDGEHFTLADGNRRTTCLKLLANPRRAPTVELQEFFSGLREQWKGVFPESLECRVETDRDRIDEMLYRRHTGVQGGIGQSTWTDRMKNNFVIRTGKSTGLNVADEIEERLRQADMSPPARIPRSNLNRLLSSEALRNRVGISVRKGKLEIIGDEPSTLKALQRVAHDLASRKVTLEDVWSTQKKLDYLDGLSEEGILPPTLLSGMAASPSKKAEPQPIIKPRPSQPPAWPHLIPDVDYGVSWPSHLQRHREIWEELQYALKLGVHSNAVSVLFRVLLELSIANYVARTGLASVHENDKLSNKAGKVAADLETHGQIDAKYHGALKKLHQSEGIISIDTLNRYVHSPNFSVSPEHLKMLWNTLADFIVLCLKA